MRARDPFLPLVFLSAVVLLAHSQSTDDVHILPREQPRQTPASLANHASPRLRIDVDLVLVPATVTDRMNRPIMDLRRQNFGLYENEAPQQIRFFSEEDEPISVGLILDVSNSMSNKIDTERAAVREFFKNANSEDDYFVISLADRPHLIADTTESLDDIQNKLALVDPKGHTALLDGIYLGMDKMRSARYQRRALLIISDGGDNHSHFTAKETRSLVRESDVLVYAIGIFDDLPIPGFKTLEEKLGRHLLTDITNASGGRTIAADKREKVPAIAATISRELRQQYLLGYKSTNVLHDGKWRKIKLQITAQTADPPLRAYYKRGYLAPVK